MRKTTTLLALVFSVAFTAKSQNISTIAGTGSAAYSGDNGAATAASIYFPVAVFEDQATGNIYICDCYNNAVRKISPAGIITTIAGTGVAGYNGDNIQATAAELYQPIDIRTTSTGNLIISDGYNNRVRMINKAGIITTIAGTGTSGYTGDNGQATAAELHVPSGLTIDKNDNIFIADAYNYVVRKVSTSGVITTYAGSNINGYGGDNGQATSAKFSNLSDISIDKSGNLFIADPNNNRLRMVNSSGIITTIAGTGTGGYNGDNIQATAAEINAPTGVATDSAGNVYFSDETNERVRMINKSGIITTIAGTGTAGYNGDGIAATNAEIHTPQGIWVNTYGSIFISDYSNNRVRAIMSPNSINQIPTETTELNLFPNPTNNTFIITSTSGQLPIDAKNTQVIIYNVAGERITAPLSMTDSQLSINMSEQPAGIYFIDIYTGENHEVKKVVKQ